MITIYFADGRLPGGVCFGLAPIKALKLEIIDAGSGSATTKTTEEPSDRPLKVPAAANRSLTPHWTPTER